MEYFELKGSTAFFLLLLHHLIILFLRSSQINSLKTLLIVRVGHLIHHFFETKNKTKARLDRFQNLSRETIFTNRITDKESRNV